MTAVLDGLAIVAPAVVALVVGAFGGWWFALRSRPEPVAEPPEEPEDSDVSEPWLDEERIEPVLGALPLGVVVVGDDGAVIHRNRFARRFESGRHGDALVAVALEETIELVVTGAAVDRPIDVYGPPPLHLRMRGVPITAQDRFRGGVVVIEDVTTALQVDRIRKDFVANVSHELKTPIGAIGLLAETLLGAGEPEIVARLANRLHEQSIRLAELVDDLLALSKLEAGPITDPELLDVREVVGLAIERAVTASGRPGAVLRCHEEAPAFVDGDRSQLVVAVSNLIDNAIKYSDDGSEVDITVGVAEGRALVSVTDRGFGIPEHDQDRVFERFYRVDDARSRVTGGTGLGLSIVRHAVLNHHGSVEVASTEGRGSTFTIRLPLAQVHTLDLRDHTREANGGRPGGQPSSSSPPAPAAVTGASPPGDTTPWPSS